MFLHRKKYQNTVLYLCRKLKGEVRGKKKLVKLLYFADFDLYEKTQKSITGDVYCALPMGPVPSALEEITTLEQRFRTIRNGLSAFERLCEVQFNPTSPP